MLTLDIETAPHSGRVWGKYEQNVIWFEHYGGIISIAWKWSDEKVAHVLGLPDYPNYKVGRENDKYLLQDFSKIVNQADVLIYQNGDRFDLPTINTRLLYHKLEPLKPIQTIDTLKIFRKHFKFPANNLDEVCAYLDVGRKIRTDKHLWKDCLDPSLPESVRLHAWYQMKKYNKHDVILTEEVCKRVLPFANVTPGGRVNKNVYDNTLIRCPNPSCGSTRMNKRGTYRTQTGVVQTYQCRVCGRYATGKIENARGILK